MTEKKPRVECWKTSERDVLLIRRPCEDRIPPPWGLEVRATAMWAENGECGHVGTFSGCHPCDLTLEASSLGSHRSRTVQKGWGSQSIWSDGCEFRGSWVFKQSQDFPCTYNEAQSPSQFPKTLCNHLLTSCPTSFFLSLTILELFWGHTYAHFFSLPLGLGFLLGCISVTSSSLFPRLWFLRHPV